MGTDAVSDGNFFIGSTVYAAIDWTLTSSKLKEMVNFYIESCDVSFNNDEGDFPIVDQNCYADLFQTKQLQQSKVVSERSALSFKSFVTGRGSKSMKLKVNCCVKVCTVDECSDFISTKDDQCKNDIFKFKANTFA